MAKEIRIDIDKMVDSKLEVQEYVVLYLVWHKDFKGLKRFAQHHFVLSLEYELLIAKLEKEGWLKIVGEDNLKDIEIRQQFIELFKPSEIEARLSDVENWIQDYRNLFRGRKPGAMGDLNACTVKMKRLLLQYPQYSKEQIMKAAETYVDSCGPTYKFLQRADYVISKEDSAKISSSRLLTFLEDVEFEPVSSGSDFIKEV